MSAQGCEWRAVEVAGRNKVESTLVIGKRWKGNIGVVSGDGNGSNSFKCGESGNRLKVGVVGDVERSSSDRGKLEHRVKSKHMPGPLAHDKQVRYPSHRNVG